MTICYVKKFLHMTKKFSIGTACGACDKYQVCLPTKKGIYMYASCKSHFDKRKYSQINMTKKQLLWLFWHQRISGSFFRAWHHQIYCSFLHAVILVKLKFLQTGKTAALVKKIPFYETCFSLTRPVVHTKQWHD